VDFSRPALDQNAAAFIDRRTGGVNIVHQQHAFLFKRFTAIYRECSPYVFSSFFFSKLGLRRRLSVAIEEERIDRHLDHATYLTSQQQRLVESTPAESFRMKRHGNNQIHVTRFQEFLAALCHKPSKRLTERNFAPIFELLHNLAQGMVGDLLSRVAAPSPGAGEIGRARQASSALMVISLRVREGTAAPVAQWMSNEPDLWPTVAAKVFSISPVDCAAASTATGRIKPIDQPIKTICQRNT
jgi:hypothetical protein